jgi:hypothetical protein
MKASTGIFSVLVIILTSCGSNDTSILPGSTETKDNGSMPTTVSATPAATAPTTAPAEAAASGFTQLNPEHGKPGHRCEIPVGSPLNSVQQPNLSAPVTAAPVSNTSSTPAANIPLNLKGLTAIGGAGGASGALNPEHGKPGHRCDIAVGAPLNGTANATPSVAQQPTAIPVSQPSATVQAPINLPSNAIATGNASAAGLNPEHGKPGHRCDIAVGAPLNSKPNATAASQPKVTSTPVITPVKPGMNPQHGQPGHRCDIAVGAPLNSKPTTTTPAVEKPADVPAVKDSAAQ